MAQFFPNITVITVDCHLGNYWQSKSLKIIVRFVPSHNLLAVSNKKHPILLKIKIDINLTARTEQW